MIHYCNWTVVYSLLVWITTWTTFHSGFNHERFINVIWFPWLSFPCLREKDCGYSVSQYKESSYSLRDIMILARISVTVNFRWSLTNYLSSELVINICETKFIFPRLTVISHHTFPNQMLSFRSLTSSLEICCDFSLSISCKSIRRVHRFKCSVLVNELLNQTWWVRQTLEEKGLQLEKEECPNIRGNKESCLEGNPRSRMMWSCRLLSRETFSFSQNPCLNERVSSWVDVLPSHLNRIERICRQKEVFDKHSAHN